MVLLGAGASRAALPNGDANGRRLPLMNDFVETVDLGDLLQKLGIDYEGKNIEDVYAQLAHEGHPGLQEVETAIYDYFDSLALPEQPTIYDYLVLSVRANDMIATFNWDPFLIQAIRRNRKRVDEPRLAFLHGNVWVGYCTIDRVLGTNRTRCSRCGKPFAPSRLLYPIAQKDYAADEFINLAWTAFREHLSAAAFFTIFGYSAPTSDREAIEAISGAWGTPTERPFEEIEIIDIRDPEELHDQWKPLIHSHHYEIHASYFDSWLARHPRRAIERYVDQFLEAKFIDNEPLPLDVDFEELWREVDKRRAS